MLGGGGRGVGKGREGLGPLCIIFVIEVESVCLDLCGYVLCIIFEAVWILCLSFFFVILEETLYCVLSVLVMLILYI